METATIKKFESREQISGILQKERDLAGADRAYQATTLAAVRFAGIVGLGVLLMLRRRKKWGA